MAEDDDESGCRRLCHLLGGVFRSREEFLRTVGWFDELPSFISEEEAAGIPRALAAEMEKDVLMSLTLVYKEVRRWTSVDRDCEKVSLESIDRNDCAWHMRPPIQCQSCLANTASLLVAFLGSRSQYVRHMAAKVLVATCGFLQKHEREWEEFSYFLWIGLGVTIQSCMPNLSHKHGSSTRADLFVNLLKSRLKRSDWFIPAALMDALQSIHKSLKNEDEDLAEVNLRLALSSMLNFDWDFLHDDDDDDEDDVTLHPNGLFIGATLRLLCSLAEVGPTTLDDASLYIRVTTLVSDLLVYCFSVNGRFNSCLSLYLRHKALALMIRLSMRAHWPGCALASWAQLIQNHFKDILLKPITESSDDCHVSLEGSPFLSSHAEKSGDIYTRHLHRQTIFLFIRCCYRSSGFNGLSELATWLQVHVPLENNSEGHAYLTSCSRFSLSFLQLFIDEDDLLFEMLLQLMDIPSPAAIDQVKPEQRRDVLLISNLFNPIRLLHLFLHLIHYDHTVLLDYLISKDSGISCVKYLLRCLRLVCESREAFSEFSTADATSNEDSRGCLLSLKTSVEGLHRRDLFPYNPAALLKRYPRFPRVIDVVGP